MSDATRDVDSLKDFSFYVYSEASAKSYVHKEDDVQKQLEDEVLIPPQGKINLIITNNPKIL